jgi:hypothetical protein
MNKNSVLLIFGLVLTVFLYPRFLLLLFEKSSPWMSYLYMYGFGLITFVLGIKLIRKSGACVPGRGRDGFWYKVLLGGYAFFAFLHGFWIFIALYLPFKGEV